MSILTATFQQSPRTVHREDAASQTQTRLESLPGTCILLQPSPLQTSIAWPHTRGPGSKCSVPYSLLLHDAEWDLSFPLDKTQLSASETYLDPNDQARYSQIDRPCCHVAWLLIYASLLKPIFNRICASVSGRVFCTFLFSVLSLLVYVSELC